MEYTLNLTHTLTLTLTLILTSFIILNNANPNPNWKALNRLIYWMEKQAVAAVLQWPNPNPNPNPNRQWRPCYSGCSRNGTISGQPGLSGRWTSMRRM